jgi:hypothetical protein
LNLPPPHPQVNRIPGISSPTPCCLIAGEGYFPERSEFWEKTDCCQNCKMHFRFEHRAVTEALKTTGGKIWLAAWLLGFGW